VATDEEGANSLKAPSSFDFYGNGDLNFLPEHHSLLREHGPQQFHPLTSSNTIPTCSETWSKRAQDLGLEVLHSASDITDKGFIQMRANVAVTGRLSSFLIERDIIRVGVTKVAYDVR
jgi:hypothetical protein